MFILYVENIFIKFSIYLSLRKKNEAISKFGGKLSPKISAKITLILW